MISRLLAAISKALIGAYPRWMGSQPEARQRIYFANHASHLDTVALWSALPPPLRCTTRPVAARDYWGSGGLKGLIAGRTHAEIAAAVPGIAEFAGLGPYLHLPMHAYSQGMAMRLAFAITTAFANHILVMDEWIGAGDRRFADQARERLKKMVESAGIIVLASHQHDLLKRICNKAVFLKAGQLQAFGDIDDVLEAYEDAKAPPSTPAAQPKKA